WPILIAVGLALRFLYLRRRRRDRAWWLMLRLTVAFAIAFFIVWSPFDFWQYLPATFSYLQFTYRILMFVTLWGALLTACVLASLYSRDVRFEHLAVCVCLVGLASAPYLVHHPSSRSYTLASETRNPYVGRGGGASNYLCCTSRCSFPIVSP